MVFCICNMFIIVKIWFVERSFHCRPQYNKHGIQFSPVVCHCLDVYIYFSRYIINYKCISEMYSFRYRTARLPVVVYDATVHKDLKTKIPVRPLFDTYCVGLKTIYTGIQSISYLQDSAAFQRGCFGFPKRDLRWKWVFEKSCRVFIWCVNINNLICKHISSLYVLIIQSTKWVF